MSGAPSEPESAAEGTAKEPQPGRESATRREMLQKAAQVGLAGLTVVSVGGMLPRVARADPNCNNPNPAGGVYHDNDCGQAMTDLTCGAPSSGNGNRWADSHCAWAPLNGDSDCGGQAGFINGGGGVFQHSDSTCGAMPGHADLDCGAPSDETGLNHWGDNTTV